MGQSEPGSDGNERVLRIPHSSSIAATSPTDCLVSYPGHSLVGGGSYSSAEKQSVYSTAPADRASFCISVQKSWHDFILVISSQLQFVRNHSTAVVEFLST